MMILFPGNVRYNFGNLCNVAMTTVLFDAWAGCVGPFVAVILSTAAYING